MAGKKRSDQRDLEIIINEKLKLNKQALTIYTKLY